MHKLAENYKFLSLIRPQTGLSTIDGTGIDIEQFEDDALATLDIGAASDTDATCIVTIKGSLDGGSTYPDTLATFGTVTATDDNEAAAAPIDLEKYTHVKAVATIAGTGTPSFAIGVGLLVRSAVGKSDLNSATTS